MLNIRSLAVVAVVLVSSFVATTPLLASANGQNRNDNGHNNNHGNFQEHSRDHRGTGNSGNGGSTGSSTHVPAPQQPPVVTPPVVTPPVTGVKTVQVYNTLYGWPDNTPKNSSDLSVGGAAGGDGTFANPITAASGYVEKNGVVVMDYAYGTKFYVPNERKYFVIGDECGDKTDGSVACHTDLDHPGVPQIDLWAGGVGAKYGTSAGNAAMSCEDTHTRINTVIFNPASNYAVVSGNVYNTSCGAQYGDTLVLQ